MEDPGEAIVGKVDGAEGWARDRFEGRVQVGGPVADVALTVVGLREDEGDPDGDEPAVGKPFRERLCWEMAIESPGKAKRDEKTQERGHIVDTFVSELPGGIHSRAPSRAKGAWL